MMGKKKYFDEIMSLAEKSPVISIGDIRRIIKIKGSNEKNAKQTINYLVKKKLLRPLIKGHYTKNDDPTLTVLCLKKAYLGMQEALSIQGLWEQETIPIIITTDSIRSGVRIIMGSRVLIKRIMKKYYYGEERLKVGGRYLPVSNKEKTLMDLLYYKENPGKEVMDELIKRTDKKIVKEYIIKYPERTQEMMKKRIESFPL
ncbi:hypothetical protein COU61_03530 [Candidatus Pacearchaeota archaeon CG10_big_fil_rev_8_21_14_0_10_35_13]|nr:MAG: hypothetical protein COU61_03530 [Candidatus Pacearchaeota archaeon CG10_big_fil_rev_8_21_14_0_10_35_13]